MGLGGSEINVKAHDREGTDGVRAHKRRLSSKSVEKFVDKLIASKKIVGSDFYATISNNYGYRPQEGDTVLLNIPVSSGHLFSIGDVQYREDSEYWRVHAEGMRYSDLWMPHVMVRIPDRVDSLEVLRELKRRGYRVYE